MRSNRRLPSLRRQRDTRGDRAFVVLDGKRTYLGHYGTQAVRDAYDKTVAEWLLNGRQRPHWTSPEPTSLTVAELVDRYSAHAEVYYRRATGEPTGEHQNVSHALTPLREMFGDMSADDFVVGELHLYRTHLVSRNLARGVVNQRVGVVRRAFRWAEGEGLIRPGKFEHLRSLPHLRRGRSEAKETKVVRPVEWKIVKATLPYLSPAVRAIVELLWHTGARVGEITDMCAEDSEQVGDVWVYRPAQHKSEHHGHERVIALGPKAQSVLAPWLLQTKSGPVFRPTGGRSVQATYGTRVIRKAVARAAQKAELDPWNPGQIRHAKATLLRAKIGIEAARTVLGHRLGSEVTETVYAERDLKQAVDAAKRFG